MESKGASLYSKKMEFKQMLITKAMELAQVDLKLPYMEGTLTITEQGVGFKIAPKERYV